MLAQTFVTVLAAPPHMRSPMLPILPDSCFPGYRTGASGAPEYSSVLPGLAIFTGCQRPDSIILRVMGGYKYEY